MLLADKTYETTPISEVDVKQLKKVAPVQPRHLEWITDSDPATQHILIIDDEDLNIRVARKYLRNWGYSRVTATNDPLDAIDTIHREQPDLILLDIMMPQISGLDILRELRSCESTRYIPVIILTAHVDEEIKHAALELGANDFLSKPIEPLEMLPRVRNLLTLRAHQKCLERSAQILEKEVQRRTAALVKSENHVVQCLARAAEYRDNDTGRHVIRVGKYASLIAGKLGLGEDYAKLIEEAAKLHDVGKIGIPDSILLKAGKLDPDEYQVMRGHCGMGLNVIHQISDDDFVEFRNHVQMGAKILSDIDSPLLTMASQIALTHHEKWDGSGYPLGLSGEQIPLEGRITAVADVFDALRSTRPYKPAFPLEKCYDVLKEGRGSHFEPRIVDAFLELRNETVAILMSYGDES